MKLTKSEIEAAAQIVYQGMAPTPQYSWPLLAEDVGGQVVVKHENHTPTGAFKCRGGLTFIDWLKNTHPDKTGIITATRGNHGQSQAYAASRQGLSTTVYVPEGNSLEKNAAMRAFGAEVIIHGADFDEARLECARVAATRDELFAVPAFHKGLVAGVSTYAYELFTAHPDLEVVYVPIGCGSGICGTIMARDALGLKTDIIGVVSENAQTAKLSVTAGKLFETNSAKTFADGMAVRVPVQAAFEIYSKGVSDIVTVTDIEIADAVRLYFTATHNIAEGAGAAPLAALRQQRDKRRGQKTAVILSGQNIDTDWFQQILAGEVPNV